MRRYQIGRMLAAVMSVCLLVGGLPAVTEAGNAGRKATAAKRTERQASGKLTLNLGSSALEEPSQDGAGWSGSKIDFGQTVSSGSAGAVTETVRWRMLEEKDGKLLLQSDAILGEFSYEEMEKWLEKPAEGLLSLELDANEKRAVAKVGIPEESNTSYGSTSYTNPAVDKNQDFFLLSAAEVTDKAYGYGKEAQRKLTADGSAGSWWLRSFEGNSTDQAAAVDKDGKLTSLPVSASGSGLPATAGLAPAFWLDGEQIAFMTPADMKKQDFFSKVERVGEYTGDDVWKLTLEATDKTLSAGLQDVPKASDTGAAVYERRQEITLTHSAAEDVLKGSDQVSALLTTQNNGQQMPVYYGKIAEKGTTQSSIPVPEDMAAGEYILYVFAEDQNKERETDYVSALGKGIPIQIAEKETPQIDADNWPVITLTYGQKLQDAYNASGVLEGFRAVVRGTQTQISGSFTWAEPELMPAAADSGKSFRVVFTPSEPGQYYEASFEVPVTVKKASFPANMPDENTPVQVGYEIQKTGQVSLPEGWKWLDPEMDLNAGGTTQATAVYQDRDNYEKSEVVLTIVRAQCIHEGGAATCISPAICEKCKQPYGEKNPANHPATELRGKKDPTCTEKGYTGDICCTSCNAVTEQGMELAATEHSYTSRVTQEPTTETEGIRTYTCEKCGHQYTESMGKHSHYFNGTRTIHWLGCEQQGEIEHYCGCGESYIEITPALGHDFKAAVTKKATTQSAGVKTYTCTRCGHAYTEEIPKLAGTNTGSSGQDTVAKPSSDKPSVKGNSGISGWSDIDKHILKAADGAVIQINMKDSRILPGKTLETLKGKNVSLLLDIGDGLQWKVTGTDITQDALKDVNLKVMKDAGTIPADKVKALAGEYSTMQLAFAQEEGFGCTMELHMAAGNGKAGYYANIFTAEGEGAELAYVCSEQADGAGKLVYRLSEPSESLLVFTREIFDGSTQETEPESSEESQMEEGLTSTEPETEEVSGETKEGVPVVIIIVIGLLAVGSALILIVALRARSMKAAGGYTSYDSYDESGQNDDDPTDYEQ